MGPTRLKLSKPVIAAVEGPAVAGGLELALWCDLRVAARDAVFGVYCRRFGVPLLDLGTIRLPRLIGHSRAMDLILTGRGILGEEAERIGLVNKVVPTDQLMATAEEMARKIMSRGPLAVRASIEAVMSGSDMPSAEGQFLEATLFGLLCASEDTKEGMKAFLEKRPAKFKGK